MVTRFGPVRTGITKEFVGGFYFFPKEERKKIKFRCSMQGGLTDLTRRRRDRKSHSFLLLDAEPDGQACKGTKRREKKEKKKTPIR